MRDQAVLWPKLFSHHLAQSTYFRDTLYRLIHSPIKNGACGQKQSTELYLRYVIEGALTEKRSTEMTHCATRSSAINSIEDFCQSKAFLAIFSKNAWGKTPQLMIVWLAHRRDALWFQMG